MTTENTFTVERITGHVLETGIQSEKEAIEVATECARYAGNATTVHYEMEGQRAGKRSLVATVDASGEVVYL